MVNIEDYIADLEPLIAFKSISTDSTYKPDLQAAADWLQDLFESKGFEAEQWTHPQRNPIVYARYELSPDAQTILVYGHYDVQPAEEADGWDSDPFQIARRDHRLHARGSVDNKGQLFIHISTVIDLIAKQELAYNVVFLIEGDEEVNSLAISDVLSDHKDKLDVDHLIVSDGEIPYRPTIEASLRGGFNLKITYKTAATNLHSGLFGGGVPNAAHELAHLLSNLIDNNQRVSVPGFYDDITPPTEVELSAAKALHLGEDALRKITGVSTELTLDGLDYQIATGYQPSLEVSGIASGYTGPGFANIIPAEATANINVRTAPGQNSKAVCQALTDNIRERVPQYVTCTIENEPSHEPIKLEPDKVIRTHAEQCLADAFGQPAVPSACGASIPIVESFREVLGINALLVSLGNNDCNMHGVNENFEIGLIEKGLKFSHLFFSKSL